MPSAITKSTPPPTFAEMFFYDPITEITTFNPVWLKWFVDLAAVLSALGVQGGTPAAVAHDSLTGIAGSGSYHLSYFQYLDITNAPNSWLHNNLNNSSLQGGNAAERYHHKYDDYNLTRTGGVGLVAGVTLAKITAGGTNGNLNFVNGVLTGVTYPT